MGLESLRGSRIECLSLLRLRRTGEDGKTEMKHGKVMWPGSHSALVAAATNNAKEWMLKIHKVWTKGATVTTELRREDEGWSES